MRIIKLGLLSLFCLFLLVLLISLLIPSHIRLSRATNLPNRREQVFALIQNDTAWNPVYKDTVSAAAWMALNKKVVEQTDSTYVVQLQQPGRRPVVSGWQVYSTPAADSLTLQWYMDFQLGWKPWQKFSSLLYESTYGVLMEKGLANLKERLAG